MSLSNPTPVVAAALLAAATVAPLAAHDFWIEPSSFRPSVGANVRLSLRVGDDFDGTPVRRSKSHFRSFIASGRSGERPVPGREGTYPAGILSIQEGGPVIVAYSSRPTQLELPAARFERYLAKAGLNDVIRQRKERGESRRPGREHFSRFAKSLLASQGGAPAAGSDRATTPLGLKLELVPDTDPYTLRPGDTLEVRLLYRNRPLAGALVTARRKESPRQTIQARSDGQGRISLLLEEPGVWLLTSVHMIEAAPGTEVDWDSSWASLTFELAASPAVAPFGRGLIDSHHSDR